MAYTNDFIQRVLKVQKDENLSHRKTANLFQMVQQRLQTGKKVYFPGKDAIENRQKFCQDGDLEMVEILLKHIKENKDLIRMNNKNQTIFMSAIKGGNIQVAEALLDRFNIDMNHVDSNGDTALTLACGRQEGPDVPLEMIAFVMQKSGKNLKPNHVGSKGQTALSKLVSGGRIDEISVFMDELKNLDPGDKFDINKSGKNGATALHVAVAEGYLECVKRILKHPDIDPNKPDKSGVTPLQMATKKASSDASFDKVAEILNQHQYRGDVSIQDESKHEALGDAIDHGDVPLVESLLAKLAQVENVHINKLHNIYNSRHNFLKHLTVESVVQNPGRFATLYNEEINFSDILIRFKLHSDEKKAAERLEPCEELEKQNYKILDRLIYDAFKYAIDHGNPEKVKSLLSHLSMPEGIFEFIEKELNKELVKLGGAVDELPPNPHSDKEKSNKFNQLVDSVNKYDSMLRAFNQSIKAFFLEDAEISTLQSCNDKLRDLQVKIQERQ